MMERARKREQPVFGADEDPHPLARFGSTQKLHQLLLVLDVLEQLADALEISRGGGILDQIGLAAHDQRLVVGIRPRPTTGRCRPRRCGPRSRRARARRLCISSRTKRCTSSMVLPWKRVER